MKTFPKSLFASVYASSAVSLTKGLKNAKEYSLIDTLIAAENYSNGHENDTTISSSPSSIFWQSSGELPHVLSFTFHKRVIINQIQIYLHPKLDESYTPNSIIIKGGNSVRDCAELEQVFLSFTPEQLSEGNGHWVCIPLLESMPAFGVFFVQMIILANENEGKDSRLRNIKFIGTEVAMVDMDYDVDSSFNNLIHYPSLLIR